MSLSQPQITALRAVLAPELQKPDYIGKTVAEIHALLHSPVIVKHPDVYSPFPFNAADIYRVISPESTARLLGWVNLKLVMDKIDAQDRQALAVWARALALEAVGILSAPDVEAIDKLLDAKVSTPVPDTIHGPLIQSLLTGENLRAHGIAGQIVVGEHNEDAVIADDRGQIVTVLHRKGDPIYESLSMPNVIDFDDFAEAIAGL